MRIYLDVDDVLAETTRAIADHAAACFGRRVAFDDMDDFELERSLRLTPEQAAQLHRDIHADAFLHRLAPVDGAADCVRGLRADGADIAVVTGRPPRCRGVTERWLERFGLAHDSLDLVDKYGRYEGEDVITLEAFEHQHFDVAVEDSIAMTEYLTVRGVRVLLFDRPWNRRAALPAGAVRIDSWARVPALIDHWG